MTWSTGWALLEAEVILKNFAIKFGIARNGTGFSNFDSAGGRN